jgi:hypothetical protein
VVTLHGCSLQKPASRKSSVTGRIVALNVYSGIPELLEYVVEEEDAWKIYSTVWRVQIRNASWSDLHTFGVESNLVDLRY